MIPEKLYHATYETFLDSIMERGLGNIRRKINSYSKPGVVALSETPDDALMSIEWTEWVENSFDSEEFYDSQVVIEVDAKQLDETKFVFIDETAGWEYHGIIPWEACKLLGYSNGGLAESQTLKALSKDNIQIKEKNGCFEIYKDNKLVCTCDNMKEVKDELKSLEESTSSDFASDFQLYENLWN